MIQEFKTYLVSIKGYSHNTAKAYGKDVTAFAKYMKQQQADARWSTITREDIDSYVITLQQAGRKAATTNRHLASISAIYDYMKRQGYEVENPCRYESRRKMGKRIPNTIDDEELRAAHAHALGATKMIIGLLMSTGIRIQELLDIKTTDIDWKENAIKIHGKGNKERMVYSQTQYMEPLRHYIEGGKITGTVFKGIEQRTMRTLIYEALKPYCKAQQLSPHAIRHTFATDMAKKGANVSQLATILGHDSIKTTQQYIDLGQNNIKECYEQYIPFN